MILYLEQNNKTDLALIYQGALQTYFKDIVIKSADQNIGADNIIVEISDKGAIIKDKQIYEFTHPYKIGMLLQSLQNLVKNKQIHQQAQPIKMGQFLLNPQTKILNKNSNDIRLTDKEFDIILFLFQSSPQKIARDQLLHRIWGYGEGIETHTLETHIYRLRQKVESNPAQPDFLKTDDDGYYLNF